jgi:aminoglycoside phosphotransferase (APT) family kinase protein
LADHSRRREERASREADEPTPDGEEWVELGGQSIWVAGWTAGGAPYGLTLEEWRQALRSDARAPGWVRARDVLETLVRLQSPSSARIELGRVTWVGEGMFRDAYGTAVDVTPDANALSGGWVVLLPRGKSAAAELHTGPSRELRVLAALQGLSLPFRVPRPLGALPGPHGIALAREFIRGIPLDLRDGKQGRVRPWEIVATIAAGVHVIDTSAAALSFPDAPATRRDHARAALRSLETLEFAEARDAAAWAAENLPPEEPAALLHGDLLGQNILIDPSEARPFAAIDWECAGMGDPAYDLAIVTRGVRRPFQVGGGLDRLLEAYRTARGADPHVTREHVRIHELCMAAEWCHEAMASAPRTRNALVDDAIAGLRRVLEMAAGARS